MINILSGCLAFVSGILLAKLLEYLFEVRWKQAQDAIAKWVGLE
jgi:hypothetical protein